MADKKPPENAAPAAEEKPRKKGKIKLLLVIGVIMAVEGLGVFYVANMFSSPPESAHASEEDALTDGHANDDLGEQNAETGGDHAKDASKDPHKSPDATGAKDAHAPGSAAKPKDDHGGGDHGSDHGSAPGAKAGEMVPPPPADGLTEIELADSRLHNVRSGRSMIVRIRVSGLVAVAKSEPFKLLIAQRKSRLHEKVCSVVRNVEPKFLDEPGLETLKRQLKYELSQVVGDPDLIREILIPELLHD